MSTSPVSAARPAPTSGRSRAPRGSGRPRPARQAVPVPDLRGPEAGAAPASLPRLLHQAVPGALRRLHRPRVPKQHRADRRLPVWPLQGDRRRPRSEDAGGLRGAGLRAGRAVPRQIVRGPRDDGAARRRRRIAGSADIIAVAVEANDANRQVFQVTTVSSPSARASTWRARTATRSGISEVAEQSLLQYYGAAPAVPGRVIVGPELKGRTDVLAEALSSQRDAQGGGPGRVARECASCASSRREREARLAQDKLRREHRRQQRVESLSALAERARLERVPVRIEGFDISNLGETHTVASMVVFEEAHRRSPITASSVRGDFDENGAIPAPPRTRSGGGGALMWLRCRRCSVAGWAATSSRPTSRRTTPTATRASPRSPT